MFRQLADQPWLIVKIGDSPEALEGKPEDRAIGRSSQIAGKFCKVQRHRRGAGEIRERACGQSATGPGGSPGWLARSVL